MCQINYPRKKYDGILLVVGILILIALNFFSYYLYNQISGSTIAFSLLAIASLYRIKTPFLLIKNGIVNIDRGFFRKKLKLELADIEGVEGYILNKETIKIIFHPKYGSDIEYSPIKPTDYTLLDPAIEKIKEKLTNEKA